MAWTDDRTDDLAKQMAAGFARTDHEIAGLRTEMRDMRVEFKSDIEGLRTEVKDDIAGLSRDIEALRSLMMRFVLGLIIGLLGLVGALIGTS